MRAHTRATSPVLTRHQQKIYTPHPHAHLVTSCAHRLGQHTTATSNTDTMRHGASNISAPATHTTSDRGSQCPWWPPDTAFSFVNEQHRHTRTACAAHSATVWQCHLHHHKASTLHSLVHTSQTQNTVRQLVTSSLFMTARHNLCVGTHPVTLCAVGMSHLLTAAHNKVS